MTTSTQQADRSAAGGRPAFARRAVALAMLAAGGVLAASCLEAPRIEDRWTRIDIQGSNLVAGQALSAGTTDSVAVNTTITYRSILTGFAVAELRASNSVSGGAVTLDPHAPRPAMATSIDTILGNSVSLGREARAVTGWDHLIEPIPFRFFAAIPAGMDTSSGARGLFLLVYLGSGQRIERRGASDTILVTPFPSARYEVLPVGMKLAVAP